MNTHDMKLDPNPEAYASLNAYYEALCEFYGNEYDCTDQQPLVDAAKLSSDHHDIFVKFMEWLGGDDMNDLRAIPERPFVAYREAKTDGTPEVSVPWSGILSKSIGTVLLHNGQKLTPSESLDLIGKQEEETRKEKIDAFARQVKDFLFSINPDLRDNMNGNMKSFHMDGSFLCDFVCEELGDLLATECEETFEAMADDMLGNAIKGEEQ